MGQLERYGLYVLVVVIFLILGVAIMGDDPAAPRADLAVMSQAEQGSPPSVGRLDVVKDLFDQPRFTDEPRSDDRTGTEGPREETPPFIGGTSPAPDRPQPEGGPGTKTAPTPAPKSAARQHVVVKGDTFSSIAEKYYGTQSKAKLIADANPTVRPEGMQLGAVLVIPEIAAEASAQTASVDSVKVDPAPANGLRYHVVAPREVLGTIAKKYYGRTSEWRRIADANPGVDPNSMRPGTRLVIPALD